MIDEGARARVHVEDAGSRRAQEQRARSWLAQTPFRPAHALCVHTGADGTRALCVWAASRHATTRQPERGWIALGGEAIEHLRAMACAGDDQRLAIEATRTTIARAAEAAAPATQPKPRASALAAVVGDGQSAGALRMATVLLAGAVGWDSTTATSWDPASVRARWSARVGTSPERAVYTAAIRILDTLGETGARGALAILAAERAHMRAWSGETLQSVVGTRKELACYYTRHDAAALAAHCAVERLDHIDWSDARAVAAIRIGDPACGTGGLLCAANNAVETRFDAGGGTRAALAGAREGISVIGADVLPAATHLTALRLAQQASSHARVVTMPWGRIEGHDGLVPHALGSLEILDAPAQWPLFGDAREDVGTPGDGARALDLDEAALDLVVMNAPFCRGGSRRGGQNTSMFEALGTDPDTQHAMRRRLTRIMHPLTHRAGHGGAGLASYFIDVATRLLADRGILSMIVPATIAGGAAWTAARRHLARHYDGIDMVSISAPTPPERRLSSATDINEVLVIARRRREGTHAPATRVRQVSLDARPGAGFEALWVARAIAAAPRSGTPKTLRVARTPAGSTRETDLARSRTAGARDAGLAALAETMDTGRLRLGHAPALALCRLDALARLGTASREIDGGRERSGRWRGPFTAATLGSEGTHPTLWRRDHTAETTLVLAPDSGLRARAGEETRAAALLESVTSQAHVGTDLSPCAQALTAAWTEAPVIGGRAWPALHTAAPWTAQWIVLWLNTTLGLIAVWGHGTRQHTGRIRIDRGALAALPIADPRALGPDAEERIQTAFAEALEVRLDKACRAGADAGRARLDALAMGAVCGWNAQALAGLDALRARWSAEPSVHGGHRRRLGPAAIER